MKTKHDAVVVSPHRDRADAASTPLVFNVRNSANLRGNVLSLEDW
jgi:hypothetical protein